MSELEVSPPPTCPRCGYVHASMYELAYDGDDGEEDWPHTSRFENWRLDELDATVLC